MAQAPQTPFDPSQNTDRDVKGTEQEPDTGMDYTGQMPMPKRRGKRDNGKRDS